MYDVVLLDLDLTLFDFHGSETAAFADSMTAVLDQELDDTLFERYRRINRRVWAAVERAELTPSEAGRRRFEELFAEIGLTDADPSAASERFQSGLGRHGALYDGVVEVLDALVAAGVRAELDDRSETLGFKIREAEKNKIPLTLVVGEQEAESGTVAPRLRKSKEKIPAQSVEALVAQLAEASTERRMRPLD